MDKLTLFSEVLAASEKCRETFDVKLQKTSLECTCVFKRANFMYYNALESVRKIIALLEKMNSQNVSHHGVNLHKADFTVPFEYSSALIQVLSVTQELNALEIPQINQQRILDVIKTVSYVLNCERSYDDLTFLYTKLNSMEKELGKVFKQLEIEKSIH